MYRHGPRAPRYLGLLAYPLLLYPSSSLRSLGPVVGLSFIHFDHINHHIINTNEIKAGWPQAQQKDPWISQTSLQSLPPSRNQWKSMKRKTTFLFYWTSEFQTCIIHKWWPIRWHGSPSIQKPRLFFFFKIFLCGPFLESLLNLLQCYFSFYVLVFWSWGIWDLSSPTRYQTCTPALEGELNY